MTISLDLIRTFEAVARTGSLSGAAKSLQLTQPTVGRHIDLLEDQLQLSLFVRSREGMTLTGKGEDMVLAARDVVAKADIFSLQAAGMGDQAQGVVRISANEIFGTLILPRALAPFMEQYPDIEVELVISNEVSNLLRRDADIAIRDVPAAASRSGRAESCRHSVGAFCPQGLSRFASGARAT